MPNDALNYYFIAKELDERLSGRRIEKIYMPSSGEIILKCHSSGASCFLLASAVSSSPRVHLTTIQKENPLSAPSFLMHLRKHIGGGIIMNVAAEPFERVVKIRILSKNEFVACEYLLVVEITGTYSNIILVDADGNISEAAKHVTPDVSPKRLVLPGIKYTPIPPQDKLVPSDKRLIELISHFDGDRPDKYILSIMSGMAPVTITECVTRALGSVRKICSPSDAEAVFRALNDIYKTEKPCLIRKDGKYIDFYTSPFLSVDGEVVYKDTLSECMDLYYAGKSSYGETGEKLKRLHSIVNTAEKRTKKKIEEFVLKKNECMDYESDRIKGELITANIYKIKKGESVVSLLNYYTNEETEITLDKNKTPSQNIAAYYKKYSKKKATLEAIDKQIKEAMDLLEKCENMQLAFELCQTKSDVEDIETELLKLKLLQNKENKNRKKTDFSSYLSVTVSSYKIDIGKNNVQNDRLYKSASDKDLWFHVKDAHGSHVILHCDMLPPDDIIASAASLAAYYSKNKMADKVAVDYTYAKYVKPISGAGLGRVTYTNQKTLFVSPKSVLDFS